MRPRPPALPPQVTNPKALLRYALPIDNKPIRSIQRELEAISAELRVPGGCCRPRCPCWGGPAEL